MTKKKYISVNLRKEWPFLLVYSLLIAIIDFFITCVGYDETRLIEHYGSIKKMPSHDRSIYQMFGLKGITLQSYLFPLIILILILIFFCIIYAIISHSSNRKYVFLLRIKGDTKIVSKTSNIHFLFVSLGSIISLAFYMLILAIFNLIASMEIMLFVFSPWVLLWNVIFDLFAYSMFILIGRSIYSDRNMLHFLREEY